MDMQNVGLRPCECHQCTMIRWKNSFAGQLETAMTGSVNATENAELASLRTRNSELEEGIRNAAKDLHNLSDSARTYEIADELESLLPPVSALKAPDPAKDAKETEHGDAKA